MFVWLRYPPKMDFDPNSIKWQCCCCQLPTGLQALAIAEMVLTTAVAVGTAVHIAGDSQSPTVFEVCLILLMAAMALTSALLIYGIQRHKAKFMYPSIFMRGVLIVFIQVFGVSTVFSPHHEPSKPTTTEWNSDMPHPPATSVALRLVLLVFAMLFLTVLIVYICYLIVRGISYEKAFARRKQRRDSLITAGMIDPDFGSRRTSNT